MEKHKMENEPQPQQELTTREKAFEFFKRLVFIEAPPLSASDHYVREHFEPQVSVDPDQLRGAGDERRI